MSATFSELDLIVPVDEARKLLGDKAASMNDEEIAAIVIEMDLLASVIVERYKVQYIPKDSYPVTIQAQT